MKLPGSEKYFTICLAMPKIGRAWLTESELLTDRICIEL